MCIRDRLKTPAQLRVMRRAGLVVAEAHEAVRAAAVPGVTTKELDAVAADVLARNGAGSSFLHYGAGFGMPPFPAVTCMSVNNEIVHGIPNDRPLSEGDLVSMDFGAIVDGWHGDAAITFGIGALSAERQALSDVTRESLWAGVAAARLGGRVTDISVSYTHLDVYKRQDPNNPNIPNAAGWLAFAMVLALGLLVMLGVIFMEQAQRRIPVQYAKRMVGRRLVGGTTTYIPLKVNQAGVIPIIFASSMLYLPMLLSLIHI